MARKSGGFLSQGAIYAKHLVSHCQSLEPVLGRHSAPVAEHSVSQVSGLKCRRVGGGADRCGFVASPRFAASNPCDGACDDREAVSIRFARAEDEECLAWRRRIRMLLGPVSHRTRNDS